LVSKGEKKEPWELKKNVTDKMVFKETSFEDMDWNNLAQDKNQ